MAHISMMNTVDERQPRDPAQVGDQIKVCGTIYQVYRTSPHPSIAARQMLFCNRREGKQRYVVTQYESGEFSSAVSI